MKKILMTYGEPFVYGGQEMFSLNLYRNINKSKTIFDFYTPYYVSNFSLIKILDKNSKFYYDNKKDKGFLKKIYYIIYFNKFLKLHKNNYDIIHINSGSSFTLAIGAYIAKKNGIKKVIVHAHSSGTSRNRHKIINKILSRYYKYADNFLACSKEAAKYHFPNEIIQKNNYTIISNGIDIEKYKYNEEKRKEYRKLLNINDNEILIGNVGRLSKEKNQIFILEILKKILNKNKNYKLLLIGNGSYKNQIKNKIEELKIKDNVIIFENRNDINYLLMAMDIFVFPSIFEGLGIALIEAEATGLPSICSAGIPKEAIVNKNCYQINDFKIDNWIKLIKTISLYRVVSSDLKKYYSLDYMIKQMESIYFEETNY